MGKFFTFDCMKAIIKANLKEAGEVLNEFIVQAGNIAAIETAAAILIKAVNSGHKIISCGNGGSMTDAMHFAEELSGFFREKRTGTACLKHLGPFPHYLYGQ